MLQHLQQQLKHAQDRMKRQADKHRPDREFAVGDQVFLKLQLFIQTSMAQRPYQKLAFRYYGPYPIISRVGPWPTSYNFRKAAKFIRWCTFLS